jgi:hypothetical protein
LTDSSKFNLALNAPRLAVVQWAEHVVEALWRPAARQREKVVQYQNIQPRKFY